MLTRFSMDLYNNTIAVQVDNLLHLFHDPSAFISEVGFDFSDTKIINYELERGVAIVERAGGRQAVGLNLPEIEWVRDNLDSIREIARREMASIQRQEEPSWMMQRNGALSSTDWIVQRHMEQQAIRVPTSLSLEQYDELLVYRQSLRDLPAGQSIPTPPDFV